MRILAPLHGLWRRKWWVIGALLLAGLAAGVAVLVKPQPPEYVTAVVERGDLVQTVEAVGTVISEKDLALEFPRSGIISSVLARESDHVTAGQTLLQLRAGDLAADVAAARARRETAEAELRALREGTRPEELRVSEAELENKRASLDAARTTLVTAEEQLRSSEEKLVALREEERIALAGDVSVAGSTVSKELATGDRALGVIDDILSKNEVLDAIIKSDPGEYELLRGELSTAEFESDQIRAETIGLRDTEDAIVALERARGMLRTVSVLTDRVSRLIDDLPDTGSYPQSDREADKTKLAAERGNVETSIKALESSVKSLRDAAAVYETKIASEEAQLVSARGTRNKAQSDILTFESAVRIGEAQLALKRAGPRSTDIAAAEARVREANAQLARAGASYGDTVLRAPVAGVITAVHVKEGEAAPIGPAITMLGDSPYRIEMFVAEIDIPKVQLLQSGSIELDAFPDVHMKLRVTEIDPAKTEVEGIAKFRVKLDFIHRHDELKVGMTGDCEIITGKRPHALRIPRRAVLVRADGSLTVRVLGDDGSVEEREVTTGMDDGKGDIEILEGVEEAETVIVLEKT